MKRATTKRWATVRFNDAIGGFIGTGLFLGAGARLQMAGRLSPPSIWCAGSSPSSFFARYNWYCIALPAAALSLTPANFGEKAAYVAGWMYC